MGTDRAVAAAGEGADGAAAEAASADRGREIVHRYRAGLAWRDLPERYGPGQTVWKRHHKWSADGTWDAVLAALLADADAAGVLDWKISADSTVVRPHQHAANTVRDEAGPSSSTGAHPSVLTGG